MLTPYLEDPDLTVYNGDALTVLRELPAESVDCCVTSPPSDAYAVESSRFQVARLHHGAEIVGALSRSDMASPSSGSCGLALLFDEAKREAVRGLRFLDPQIRQECLKRLGGFAVCQSPSKEGTASLRVGIFCSDVAAERGREQVERFTADLANVDPLAVNGLSRVTTDSHGVGAASDADCPIGVEDSSEVGKCDPVHVSKNTRGG